MAISKAKRVYFSCLSSWILDLSEICFALEIDKKKKDFTRSEQFIDNKCDGDEAVYIYNIFAKTTY